MPALNIIELNVDNKTHSYARVYSSLINDEYQRKRSYASLVALFALTSMLEKTKNSIQKSMTLFRQPKINEEFEISDFYVNNWHIDVRVLVDGDAVLLPKKHFDNYILPDFYAVVKVDRTLNNAELLGFIDPQTVNKQPLDYHYFSATLDSLISYNEFLTRIENQKAVNFAEEEHQTFREKYLNLLDDELDKETKGSLLRHMFACPMCRTEFCCFTGFEMVSCNMGKYPDLMDDQTLGIVGATAVDSEQYEGKEEVISIVDEEPGEQEKQEEQQDEIIEDRQQDNEEEQKFEDELVEAPVEELKEEKTDDEFSTDVFFDDIVPMATGSIFDDEPATIVEDEPLEDIASLSDEPINPVEEIKDEIVEDDFGIIEDTVNSSDLIVEDFEENADKQMLMAEMPENNLEIDTTSISEIEDIKEETVSDILDELFSIDEVYEDTTFSEKGVDISPKEESFIEDISPAEEYVETFKDEFSDEFDDSKDTDFIERDLKLVNDPSKEFEYDEGLEYQDDPAELEIHGDFETKPQQPQKVETIENIDIQNVIVDYDEVGNPIYSYITDIPEDQMSNAITEVEDVEDNFDILDEQYETYSAEENNNDQTEEIIIKETQDEFDDNFDDIDVLSEGDSGDYSYSDEETAENYSEQALDDENQEYGSEFDADDYVDETDESIPEERVSSGNPLAGIVVLLGLVAVLGFGGYAAYQNFIAKDKEPVVETKNVEEEIANAINPEVTPEEEFEEPEESTIDDVEGEEVVEEQPSVPTTVPTAVETPIQTPVQAPVVPDNLPKLPEVKPTSNNIDLPPLTEKDLLTTKTQANKSIASAFSANSAPASVKNVNWLCTPQLFTDPTFKAFLQDIDGLLKMNLRKNILNATETPKNQAISIKMAVDNNGKIEKMIVSESSGSEQIDNIVLQSINESLTGKKSPILNDGKLKADRYHLKVVIKL